MKLRIGNQTAFVARSPFEPFEFALEHGFGAFEFFPDHGPSGNAGWHEDQIGAAERGYIRRAAEACDVRLPRMDWCERCLAAAALIDLGWSE